MVHKLQENTVINKNSSIFIATFAYYENGAMMPNSGMIAMISFFVPKVRKVCLLLQPHPGSDRINPEVELYEDGKVKKKFDINHFFYVPIYLVCKLSKEKKIRISYKIRDVLSVLFIGFTQKQKYDLFIGLEAVDLIAGLLLKKMGLVKKIVYYVSDYSPVRFRNKWLNAFYVWLDRFALLHADYTWDASSAMQKGRIEGGLSPDKKYRVIHVPNGLFPSQIQSLPIEKRNKFDLVYMGILELDMGPDLAIKSLLEVKKQYASVKLHIVGGAEKDIEPMRELVRKLNLAKDVIFYGFVKDNDKMAEIVRSCYIGLAPYRAFPNSKRWYGDAGKIRQYIASGLPVVTTHVPPLGREIVEKGAGIMTKDTVEDFSKGIIKLLSNDVLYKKLATVSEKISKDNTWENVYAKAFRDMESLDKDQS